MTLLSSAVLWDLSTSLLYSIIADVRPAQAERLTDKVMYYSFIHITYLGLLTSVLTL